MVGHTGDIDATVVACKAADDAVKVCVGIFQLLILLLKILDSGISFLGKLYGSIPGSLKSHELRLYR